MTRPLRQLAMAALILANTACVNQAQVRNQLQSAAHPGALPNVVACWESYFEEQDFSGALTATADFSVAAASGAISNVSITALQDDSGAEPRALDPKQHPFGVCLAKALDGASLGSQWADQPAVRATDMRLAFIGPSQEQLGRATPQLVGPRADRCRGLYGHWPPRDAATIHGELSDAEDKAARTREQDADRYARALQRAYDLALELRQRLKRDGADEGLSEAAQKHLHKEESRANRKAQELGAQIGCELPR